ncbi:glycosyltransferase [Macrococcus caseolyticus]|uniref:glycosyltransferase n=1 Tax=Macrococcoides caseolyticum TaxID=69966 RepID=UPI0024BCD98C|nr:glycosyltransferase [Macrococcus caseolyticus]MDJ1109158.1 glycosyltransferase [Macrococcus caseolyticus]
MRIIVLDYARDIGGANTISEYFNRQVLEDKENKWLWLTSNFDSFTGKNIKNLRVRQIKKSIFHRLYFERLVLKKINNEFKPDLIISLQNFKASNFAGKQLIYVHQAIAFVDDNRKFSDSLFKELKFQMIKKKLKNDVKNSDYIIVQTDFMKNKIYELNKNVYKILPELFHEKAEIHKPCQNFIYPTNSEKYKRFDLVIEVARTLKNNNLKSNISITLGGEETSYIKKIKDIIINESLPIHFIGKQDKQQLQELYRNNHLLFTSEIESLGLPLVEAMHYGCKILAFEQPFTCEVLNNYKDAYIFNENNILFQLNNCLKSNDEVSGLNVQSENILSFLKSKHIID